LYSQIDQLTQIQDPTPYLQLLARIAGLLSYQAYQLVPCAVFGFMQTNGFDFYDAGYCSGKLISAILDVQF
jgi:hypothetical protein